MLTELSEVFLELVGQCLVRNNNDKIARLCNLDHIDVKRSACDKAGRCQLHLYKRRNESEGCRQEAGIIYRPGPSYANPEKFSLEMLRLFSLDKDACFDIAEKYFSDLVVEKKYRQYP